MSDKNNEVSDTMSTSSATSSLSPPFSDPPKPWYRDPMVSSTVVIASATVVNLFVSCGLWISTKDSVDVTRAIFETANRPYVGLQGVGIVPDSDKSGGVSIVETIRNFGTVPAYNFDATWEVSLGGEVLPGTRVPQNRSTLSPGNSVSLPGHLNGPTFNKGRFQVPSATGE